MLLYLRKVGRIYRAGFVSSKELETDFHMDFKRVRPLNRQSDALNIEFYSVFKNESLEARNQQTRALRSQGKMAWKENEMLRMKSIVWEILVDIADETLNISIKKKFWPKPLKLSCRYPLLGMSLRCSHFLGFPVSLGMRLLNE